MDPQEPVRRFYDALNAHDAKAVVACLKPGGTWNCPAVANTSLSDDGIASFVNSMITAFPDLKFKVGSMNRLDGAFLGDSGPDIFMTAFWIMTGTHSGVFQGLAPTGKQIFLMGTDLFRVEGEQLSCLDGVWDSATLPLQLEFEVIQRAPRKAKKKVTA